MNKDIIARKISNWLLRIQEDFALFMNRKTKRCSIRSMKISCFITCLLLAVISTWTIVDAIRGKKPMVSVSHIKTAPLLKTTEPPGNILPVVSSANLKRYQNFTDSLHKNNLRLYDSIVRLRPGLGDSLLEIEKIYSLQQ